MTENAPEYIVKALRSFRTPRLRPGVPHNDDLPGLYSRLLENGKALDAGAQLPDLTPVLKLYTPDAGCTWLIAALDPDDPDKVFGLCPGDDPRTPRLGYARLAELKGMSGRLGLPIERDPLFTPNKDLGGYLAHARANGGRVDDC